MKKSSCRRDPFRYHDIRKLIIRENVLSRRESKCDCELEREREQNLVNMRRERGGKLNTISAF
jgi:hypothetical protein